MKTSQSFFGIFSKILFIIIFIFMFGYIVYSHIIQASKVPQLVNPLTKVPEAPEAPEAPAPEEPAAAPAEPAEPAPAEPAPAEPAPAPEAPATKDPSTDIISNCIALSEDQCGKNKNCVFSDGKCSYSNIVVDMIVKSIKQMTPNIPNEKSDPAPQ
jgi:hypothetical protein